MAFQQPALLNGHPEQQQISFASEAKGLYQVSLFQASHTKMRWNLQLVCLADLTLTEPISETLSLSIAQHLSASLSSLAFSRSSLTLIARSFLRHSAARQLQQHLIRSRGFSPCLANVHFGDDTTDTSDTTDTTDTNAKRQTDKPTPCASALMKSRNLPWHGTVLISWHKKTSERCSAFPENNKFHKIHKFHKFHSNQLKICLVPWTNNVEGVLAVDHLEAHFGGQIWNFACDRLWILWKIHSQKSVAFWKQNARKWLSRVDVVGRSFRFAPSQTQVSQITDCDKGSACKSMNKALLPVPVHSPYESGDSGF